MGTVACSGFSLVFSVWVRSCRGGWWRWNNNHSIPPSLSAAASSTFLWSKRPRMGKGLVIMQAKIGSGGQWSPGQGKKSWAKGKAALPPLFQRRNGGCDAGDGPNDYSFSLGIADSVRGIAVLLDTPYIKPAITKLANCSLFLKMRKGKEKKESFWRIWKAYFLLF